MRKLEITQFREAMEELLEPIAILAYIIIILAVNRYRERLERLMGLTKEPASLAQLLEVWIN